MKKDDNYFCFFLFFFQAGRKGTADSPAKKQTIKTKQRGCPDYCNANCTKIRWFLPIVAMEKILYILVETKKAPLPLPPEKKKEKSSSSVVKSYLKVVSKMEFMTAKCQVKVSLIL